ncbi:hypothetical protein HMPREF1572_00724 [Gardnerella vaginalis JCP7275]|nr:hypothetical protein HMPREF1572_00724 [Gardnerella vaginalis JCP7275]
MISFAILAILVGFNKNRINKNRRKLNANCGFCYLLFAIICAYLLLLTCDEFA